MTAPILDQLERRLDSPGTTFVSGPRGACTSLVLTALGRRRNRPLLLIVPDQETANSAIDDLEFFTGLPGDRQSSLNVLPYPAPDVEPYDILRPHPLLAAKRMASLHHLRTATPGVIIVASAEALLRRVPPPQILEENTYQLTLDQDVDRERLVSHLVASGYFSTEMVEDVGCFSVRGGVLDVFSPAHRRPARIEFFGDTIESIRLLDLATQRSSESIERYTVIPAREQILEAPFVTRAGKQIKVACDEVGCPTHVRKQIIEDLESGISFPGMEYLDHLLYPELVSFDRYLDNPEIGVVLVDPRSIQHTLEGYRERLEQRFATVHQDDRFFPPPDALFGSAHTTLDSLMRHARLSISDRFDITARQKKPIIITCHGTSWLRDRLASLSGGEHPILPLVERLKGWLDDQYSVLITVQSSIQAMRLAGLIEPHGIPVKQPPDRPDFDRMMALLDHSHPCVHIVLGHVSAGFVLPELRLALVTEQDIFGERVRTTTQRTRLKRAISDFSQLERGDLVVHAVHGLGIFRGLKKLVVGNTANDFVLIEYRGGDKLYLPVHRLAVLQRYAGTGATPGLDKLGGSTFARKKRKARKAVLKLARELLSLEAARNASPGFAFKRFDRELEAFATTFPYEETDDQAAAIEAVIDDMCAPQPMDRLVCGDVGYGKTEVAIRAAYLAVLNGKQVAVLAPTTVLALQHYRSFQERFRSVPVLIEMLSRFSPAKKQREVLKRLEKGEIDIIIGTHRLLSTDVTYRDLGLLVIDEEQRFGVAHKERLKKARVDVDVLTLTATPIPRTLYMVLGGLRAFSLVATPPPGRLAVRTHHIAYSPEGIQRAIRAELQRGGQVYYVHNRVQTIYELAETLQKLVPEASIVVAHGQMRGRELERVMTDFVRGKHDVLCCTSIIENGLDIPLVNTIIVDGAERLGLSQLYQLRGRVGRSSRRAYAYLVTRKRLPGAAYKRIRALIEHSELGSGFKIARKDLELRGAGDLLGPSQSGPMGEVGIEMYTELLEQAIRELRGGEQTTQFDPEIDLKVSAYFPDDYIPNFHDRLHYYKILSQAESERDVQDVMEEIEDRYGPLPDPVLTLADLMTLNTLLKNLGISSLTYGRKQLIFQFDSSTPVDPRRISEFVLRDPSHRRVTPDSRLILSISDSNPAVRMKSAKKVLRLLR